MLRSGSPNYGVCRDGDASNLLATMSAPGYAISSNNDFKSAQGNYGQCHKSDSDVSGREYKSNPNNSGEAACREGDIHQPTPKVFTLGGLVTHTSTNSGAPERSAHEAARAKALKSSFSTVIAEVYGWPITRAGAMLVPGSFYALGFREHGLAETWFPQNGQYG